MYISYSLKGYGSEIARTKLVTSSARACVCVCVSGRDIADIRQCAVLSTALLYM